LTSSAAAATPVKLVIMTGVKRTIFIHLGSLGVIFFSTRARITERPMNGSACRSPPVAASPMMRNPMGAQR